MKYLIKYILIFHIILVAGLTVSRIILYNYVSFAVQPVINSLGGNYFLGTLIQGLWRDNVLATIVSIPAFCWLLIKLIPLKWRITFVSIYYTAVIPFCLFVAIGNIPYFSEFYKVLDWKALEYLSGAKGSIILAMLLSELKYYGFALAGIAIWVIFTIFVIQCSKRLNDRLENVDLPLRQVVICLIVGAVVAIAIIISRPSNVNQALFSSDPQYDKIAICPPLYFVHSIISRGDAFDPAKNFISFVSESQLDSLRYHYDLNGYYFTSKIDTTFEKEMVSGDIKTRIDNPNIVLIQMEGMSAKLMSHFGNKDTISPFLDSLYESSLSFSNCYSIGPRTNFGMCGIYSSWPTFLSHHAIQSYLGHPSKGLSLLLHDFGYHNVFFLTHDITFDGLDYYLPRLKFDEIYSQNDYPASEIVGPWGCNDGYLFDYALDKLNAIAASKSPFFASIMTITNHPPYIIPKTFHGNSKREEFLAAEYADEQLRKFYQSASQQDWFDKTLFVFVADHGNIQFPAECELPEQLNHIPLIINGCGIKPQICETMTSQMDIMAIVLGLLGKDYIRTNFSVNVLQNPRKYVVYSSQSCLGCRSEDRLYVYNADVQKDSFYMCREGSCSRVDEDSIFVDMRNYLHMIYQMADNMTHKYRR